LGAALAVGAPQNALSEAVNILILAMFVLPIVLGLPFGMGWLLDRKMRDDEGPRIFLCLVIAELWTLLLLAFGQALTYMFLQIFLYPPNALLVLAGHAASRWRRRVVARDATADEKAS
jgi:hypothetical protein